MWKKALIFSAVFLLAAVWLVSDLLLSPLEKPAVVLEIPDFCGHLSGEVERAEWMEIVEEYRYDATVPAGTVLSQTPAGGSRRRAVELPIEICLVISLGEEQIRLPETVGENVRVAAARLRELGCVVEIDYEVGAEPEGEVLRMEPDAGKTVARGSRVVLLAAAGQPERSVSVPDLRGLTRSEALTRLWMAGLTLGEVVEEASLQPAGQVIRQSHQPGTIVLSGTRVTLYVSREWEFEVE